MKNWVIISVCLVILSLSQARYHYNSLSNQLSEEAGVYLVEPEGFQDPFFHYSKLISHGIELIFTGFIFACAMRVEKRDFFALMLSLLLMGGAVNQFVDRWKFDPYIEGKNEQIGFWLYLIFSVVLALKWRHRNTTQI